MQLAGIHHLTAITADLTGNKRFYTETLGLRLVKKTVNQDDTSAYHLFYSDGKASPGTDLTFFDWPAAPERRGTNSISRTGLRLAGEKALDFWAARLRGANLVSGGIDLIDGRASLDFEDPEGQRFRLVDDGGDGPSHPWEQSSVSPDYQIRGLGPITISVRKKGPTDTILTQLMNMSEVREYPSPDGGGTVHVYQMGDGGACAELHVAVQPDLPFARQGAGGVHHVAFRTPNAETLRAWNERVSQFHVPSSGEVERYYFRSLYFREPGGNLFEIATDEPGFTVDEPLSNLGEWLSLPPFLEGQRAAIEARLKSID